MYNPMGWDVEYTDEFGSWWSELSEPEQESVAASVRLLEELGPNLGFPHSSGINGSKHNQMRELRTQHEGRPYRTLYAFDPRRCAILLIGGDKTGNNRWYETSIPAADRLYDEHLQQLKKEGLING
ncbi:MAG: type II toxin-antitoxin system RelE/ParE family toxin [Trichlorobacter sp.]|nr:type II toxin-antitoxin system RelE/ParE family toxin [Trichlorobacter sp.]